MPLLQELTTFLADIQTVARQLSETKSKLQLTAKSEEAEPIGVTA